MVADSNGAGGGYSETVSTIVSPYLRNRTGGVSAQCQTLTPADPAAAAFLEIDKLPGS